MGINFKKPAAVQPSAEAPPPKPEFEDHLGPPWKEEPPKAVAAEIPEIKVSQVNKVFNPETKVTTVTGEKHKTEQLPPVPTAEQFAKVSVGAGRKLNLGNYESADVSVHLSLPCKVDEIEATFKKTIEWVEKKMADALGEAAANPVKK